MSDTPAARTAILTRRDYTLGPRVANGLQPPRHHGLVLASLSCPKPFGQSRKLRSGEDSLEGTLERGSLPQPAHVVGEAR